MITDDLWYMKIALEEAERAYRVGEVPVGALCVSSKGEILAQSYNLKETKTSALLHAEMIVMDSASKLLQNWRLTDVTLYVTLEPCPMCLAAMVQSRISRLVFGAYDPKGGALSLGYNLQNDPRLNHKFSVTGGLSHYDCSKILSQFFKERRTSFK